VTATQTKTTMKRAVLRAPNDLEIETVPIPALEPGDVLLRVESALICGTDLRIFDGTKTKNVVYPSVLGHEFAGEIVASEGELPGGLALGDRVAVYPLVQCGTCASCERGRGNICRNRLAFGYQIDGGFAEYVRIPAVAVQGGNLVAVGDTPADVAAVIEPLACAYNGQRLIDAENAGSMLVIGSGPLGQLHIRLARALGVETIVAVDPASHRREIALNSGASAALDPAEMTQQRVDELTGGVGFDTMVVAVGRADAMEPYLQMLAPGGRVNVFAGFPTGTDSVTIPANAVHYNETMIVGSSSCQLSDFRKVAELVRSGAIAADGLVTAHLPIDQLEQGLERARKGIDLRISIDATSTPDQGQNTGESS
jgi:L-iditol 2-dehydrogenase